MWITGLPGSGKTTIASRVAEALTARGVAVQVLDLTDVRAFLAHGAMTPLGEDIAHRVLVYAAKRLTDAGIAVIVDASAPARAWRDLARALIDRFAEVQSSARRASAPRVSEPSGGGSLAAHTRSRRDTPPLARTSLSSTSTRSIPSSPSTPTSKIRGRPSTA